MRLVAVDFVGKVDYVGDLLRVQTRCLLLLDLPVIPLGSYAVLNRPAGEPDLAVRIPFSLKSWAVGWANRVGPLVLFASIVWFCVELNRGLRPAWHPDAVWPIATFTATAAVLVVAHTVTGIALATPRRRADLLRRLGLADADPTRLGGGRPGAPACRSPRRTRGTRRRRRAPRAG